MITSYLRSLGRKCFRRARTNVELNDELGSHIQLRIDDLVRSGCEPAQAERQARIEFGSTERIKEECREQSGGRFIDNLIQDVRFSFRMLRKSPGFTVVVVIEGRMIRVMILRQGLRLAIAGAAIGLLSGVIVSRLMAGVLYGVRPSDPLTFAGVTVAFITVALLACLRSGPARYESRSNHRPSSGVDR
jgi:hypothetical protein